jgi:hypothetical protein
MGISGQEEAHCSNQRIGAVYKLDPIHPNNHIILQADVNQMCNFFDGSAWVREELPFAYPDFTLEEIPDSAEWGSGCFR